MLFKKSIFVWTGTMAHAVFIANEVLSPVPVNGRLIFLVSVLCVLLMVPTYMMLDMWMKALDSHPKVHYFSALIPALMLSFLYFAFNVVFIFVVKRSVKLNLDSVDLTAPLLVFLMLSVYFFIQLVMQFVNTKE